MHHASGRLWWPLLAIVVGCQGREPALVMTHPAVDIVVPAGDSIAFRSHGRHLSGDGWRVSWRVEGGSSPTVAEGQEWSYAFSEPGEYVVRVLATGPGGRELSATRRIGVLPAPPPGNYALRFFGTGAGDVDRVKIPVDDPDDDAVGPPADLGATDFTIEFWLKADPGANGAGVQECGANVAWINGNVILDRDRYSRDRKYGLSLAGGRIVFGVSGAGTGDRTLCGVTRVDDGAWHHVAVTRTRANGGLSLYVDGVPEAAVASGPGGDISYPDDATPGRFCDGPCTADPFLVLGAEKHDAGPSYPSFRGWLDELRLSKVVRYRGAFSPPTAAFSTDSSTVALYHFDAGAGDLLRDASHAVGGPSTGYLRVGGAPVPGPAWVASDAPTSGAGE